PHGFAAFCFELGDLFWAQVAVVAVVAEFEVAAGCFVAGFGFFGGGIGRVNVSGVFEFLDDVLVDVTALRLAVGFVWSADFYAFVPVDAHPDHGVEALWLARFGVAFGVGVFPTDD